MSRKSVADVAWLFGFLFATGSTVGGCVPTVAHGPRVTPGLSGGLSASYPFGPRYSQGDWGAQPFMFGPAGVNLSHGWRNADADDGAFQLGMHIPVMAA